MRKTKVVGMLLALLMAFQPLVANATPESRMDGTLEGCTIWITQETNAYDVETGETVRIPKGEKMTVTKESENQFTVIYGEQNLKLDNTYVLINVKEYIPSLEVNLQMAQPENLFFMGDEKIPGLTDKQFYTSEGAKDHSEAWLRYGVAQKLLEAQRAFQEDGYSIIIYDAYRPYPVTLEFKNCFRQYLNSKSASFKKEWFGTLGQNWFLAQKASAHNYGRAIDMGLRDLASGEVVEMPSNVHTLDKRAAQAYWEKQADMAWYMNQKMKEAGFTGLISEWWHFQDNDIPNGNVIDLAL